MAEADGKFALERQRLVIVPLEQSYEQRQQ
jgi:hypothetical protein